MNLKRNNDVKEVAKELVGWEDNKLFNTIRDLTIRPGKMACEYCSGETQKYFSPIVYFLGVTSFVAYVNSLLGLNDAVVEMGKKSFEEILKAFGKHNPHTIEIAGSYLSFLMGETFQKLLGTPPLLAFTWLFYKKYNPDFKENCWIALYATGHASLFSLAATGYWFFTRDMEFYIYSTNLIYGLNWIWASTQFYQLSMKKSLISGIGFILLFGLVSSILFNTIPFLTLMYFS